MDTPWKPVLIFPDENEEALKERFAELCAFHPGRSEYEIAQYIFQDLKEPELRANQAAQVWSKDIEIQERIRQKRLRGPLPEPGNIEKVKAELYALATNNSVPHRERLVAYKQYCELQGWVDKLPKKVAVSADGMPTFVIAQYPDD